jgi:uncharacterized membrane protein
MNYHFYVLIFTIIMSGSFCDFYNKKAIEHVDYRFFYLYRMCLTSICLGFYLFFIKRLNCLKYLLTFNFSTSIMAFFTMLGVFIFIITRYYLLQTNETSYLIPIISSSSIILSFVFGYIFFRERIDKFKILGAMFVLPGLYIFSGSNNSPH